MLKYYI